ncbi:Wzz/FepE/Etk N-terminal domain-containing protein [Marinomonas ostreistagni]|uniref:Wzz/FepE/Etk N-terminal domain-containing protein n=1 Tax=Marinomonas ostreistagni TaxID=359209 RepID=UPI00194DB128|nr:Wzz/FepE/Etk N-terminal domain-containing protein [Marinomonas ostreistagni]MBM6552354.1 hypothetical protein [Marinomonas ostreistagni]
MEQSKPLDDEIDLFELFQTLWEGKWLITAFVVLALVAGGSYAYLAQPKFNVSVPYAINIYPVSAQQICDSNVSCIEGEVNKRLSALSEGKWSLQNASVSISTTAPAAASVYAQELSEYQKVITSEVYREATVELNLIQNDLNEALLNTERVATNMLNAKRTLQMIDNGQQVVSFGSVNIAKTAPKVPLILALSIVLGGMVGVFYVLVRSMIRKRKDA